MNYITEARYIKDFQIEIVFNDNKKGVVDLKNIIENDSRSIFQELKDKTKFSQIRVDMDTIIWQNGLDLAPEFLYKMIQYTEAT